MIENGALDIETSTSIGLTMHAECDYFISLAFPGWVEAGQRVSATGSSSVSYVVGLFGAGEAMSAACRTACSKPNWFAHARRTLRQVHASELLAVIAEFTGRVYALAQALSSPKFVQLQSVTFAAIR